MTSRASCAPAATIRGVLDISPLDWAAHAPHPLSVHNRSHPAAPPVTSASPRPPTSLTTLTIFLTMAKPRNSVLYMFDPLHQSPSTPRRDSSDDCGPSDKENDIPPGDLTVFFNRMYVTQKPTDARVFTPKGKLIDIGDTPAPERVWDGVDHDGSDADGELSESDVES